MLKTLTNIKLLCWFNFFNDFRPYNAVAVIYFAQVTGSYALALAVYSVSYISSAVFELPTGVLSDLVGRKRTIVLGALCATLSIILYAFGGSFGILAVGSILDGLAQSFFSGNNEALLYDSLKENKKESFFSELLGKTSSMFQLGLGTSAFIGGFLADWSLSFVMWVSVIPQAFGLLVALYITEPNVHSNKHSTNVFDHLSDALKRFKENYSLRMISLASIWSYTVGETIFKFVPAFYASLWPLWAIGLARSLSHAASAASY
ncbi:MAG TPA: MFS transporter [Patescibacteria group bacterium]|nr:MFS transporter [Patescibacteria group bacterium]